MAEFDLSWWTLPLFFGVALLYSSVGHGGASGYLALFALLGIATSRIVPIALTLNILVAGIGFFNYSRRGFFSFKLLLPFVLASIPAAYIGGSIQLPTHIFGMILGSALLAAAVRMLFLHEVHATAESTMNRWPISLTLGGVLGLISGLVGIGGGVFLSPILLFMKWADAKQTAAVSAAFIVLNSMSGLAGHLSRGNIEYEALFSVAAVVLGGGLIGSYLGARFARPRVLQILLGIVLLIAGGKLLLPFLKP